MSQQTVSLDAALQRSGLTIEDLKPKSFESFRSEAPRDPIEVVAKRFQDYHEYRNRKLQLVLQEKRLIVPQPPASESPSQLLLTEIRKSHRQNEKRRLEEAASRKKKKEEDDLRQAEDLRIELERKEQERQAQAAVIKAINNERARQRFERDEQVAKLRRDFMSSSNSRADEVSLSASSTPRRSPRGESRVDKRVSAAREVRQRIREESERHAQDYLSRMSQKEQEAEIRQLILCDTKSEMHLRRQAKEQEVANRATVYEADMLSRLAQQVDFASSRGSAHLSSTRSARENKATNEARMRAECQDRAMEYRLFCDKERARKHAEKVLDEQRRATELREREEENFRRQHEESERKAQQNEENRQRIRRARQHHSRELSEDLQRRMDAASKLRDRLINEVYTPESISM